MKCDEERVMNGRLQGRPHGESLKAAAHDQITAPIETITTQTWFLCISAISCMNPW